MAIKKVTINLPEEQILFLKGIAKKKNITFTDAIRRAIAFESFFVEQEDKGRKILVEEKDRRLREIIRN